jgi:hypothetical protein
MNFKSLSKTTNQTLGRHKITFDYLIVASLVALVIIFFAAQGVASAQGPPDQVVSENALGNSPFADQLSGEEPITVTGILNVLIEDDFANKRSRVLHFLKDAKTKETYKLRFSKKAPGHLHSGATVKARGRAKNRELYLALDESGEENIETLLPAQAVVAGEQNTIVLVVNFLNASVSCPVDEIQELMFTDPFDSSIDDFYQETSLGNIRFGGDVVGPYTIDYSSTEPCEYSAWATAAESSAQAEGVDISAYDRKVYVFPRDNSCGWAGLATIGGNPSRAWIFRCDGEDVFAHELGHNLGMHHASTPTREYGDTSDIMGYSGYGLRQLNAPHQEQMGWRAAEKIFAVTESGLYEIAPLEFNADQTIIPQMLKIAKLDTSEYYYLSYRKPIGFDNNLPASYRDRLNIHAYKGDGSAGKTFFLDALADSESFVDTINGISITQESHTNELVTVQIQLEAACTPAAPLVSISPANQSAVPGAALNYNVAVTNNDGPSCTQSSFSLNSSVPAGWSGTLVPVTLNLLPGETGQAILTVTSPVNSEAKTYLLNLDVSNAAEPLHTGSGHASYVVVATCAPAEPTVDISPTSQNASPGATLDYTVVVSNTDANCGASTLSLSASLPGGWVGNISHDTLTLSPSDSATATLSVTSPNGAAEASYGFTVNVSDGTEAMHSASTGGSYVVEGINEVDTEAPTVPGGLSAGLKGKNVKLTWNAATDNVGVSGYAVWRDGARIGDATDTGYVDSSVPSSKTCTYTVGAYDAAGNMSASSSAVRVTTRGGSKGGGKGKPK